MTFLKHLAQNCKRDRKRTEQALIEAASKLFASRGYDATRTAEIAKEAGVNEALIARYFGGKQGLLQAVMEEKDVAQVIRAQVQLLDCSELVLKESRSEKDLFRVFRRFFNEQLKNIPQREGFMRIATSRTLVDANMAEVVRKSIIDEKMPKLEEGLKEILKGRKKSSDEVRAAAMILAANEFMMNFMLTRVYQLPPDEVDSATKLLCKMMAQYFNLEEQER